MNYNEQKEMNRITKKLGIKTFGELYRFKQEEQKPNETLIQTLKRYEKEENDYFNKEKTYGNN